MTDSESRKEFNERFANNTKEWRRSIALNSRPIRPFDVVDVFSIAGDFRGRGVVGKLNERVVSSKNKVSLEVTMYDMGIENRWEVLLGSDVNLPITEVLSVDIQNVRYADVTKSPPTTLKKWEMDWGLKPGENSKPPQHA